MRRSKTIEKSRAREMEAIKKMPPSAKLLMVARLTDCCLKLTKAGAEAAKRRVIGKKPKGSG